MEVVEKKKWWTKKNYNKLYKCLKKNGVYYLEDNAEDMYVPEIGHDFRFWGVCLDDDNGVGFIYWDYFCISVDTERYRIGYERVFYYNKLKDRTFILKGELADNNEIYSEDGFVKFWQYCDAKSWVESVLKEISEEENNENEQNA